MVKYIVGGVIVVLSWALAIIIEFPLWIPSLITLVVLLWLLLMFGIAKLRERRAARELEKALQAQAAAQAASARPDLQHEIAEMQAEFQKAVAALKGTKKGGTKALYALPWYTIIGPPGSGKSTALRNSGIQFPYLSASGGGVRGLGGTRNCDWWMTSEAVILDTAGRWTSEDEDHDEWLGFLDLVKRFRPKKPLNGMIAAVSIGDVGGAREDEVVALARRIRERIDEVQARLSLSLPVYVLFTKCDLLPGFLETFGDMSKEERSQIWGFTAPLTKPIGPAGQYFLKGFEELVAMLDRRALKRMGEERKVASREMIFAFPQQIEVMRNNLQEFVHHLFIENVFKETPRLRGVYFTSGTQEGRPIDRVMSAMAEAFGQPQVQLPAPQVESKSYFLRDMFMSIVFRDAEAAVRSPEEIRRQRRRTYLTAGAIFTLALGISGLPALAWATNRGFLNETKEVVDSARETVAEGEAHMPIEEPAIHALYTRVTELEENDRMGAPLHMRMGMYQSDVYEPVRDVYLEAMRRRVVGPMFEADVAAMIAFGQRYEALQAPPDAEELRAMYERLKLHLLLTRPNAPLEGGLVEPEADDELQDYMSDQLHLRWTTVTETRRSDQEYRRMREQVAYYVEALAEQREDDGEHGTELTFPRNDAAVAAVRGVLSAVGGYHMAVQGIIAEIRPLNYDIRLVQLVGQIGSMQARTMVRGAFTKRAWDERVERMLENDAPRFFGENWVLGHPPPESERQAEVERELQVAGLRSYFLEQYVQEWKNFIASLYVVRATTPQEHMQVLTEFTSGEPQLMTRLIRLIDANVSLARPEGGLSPSEVQRRAEREAQLAATRRLGRVRGLGDANAARLLGVGRAQAEQQLANNGLAPTPADMTPIRVRMQFSGFLDFAPVPPPNTPAGQAELVTPARRYEEQLEYLRDALGFRMAGTEVTNFDERQASALALTTNLIQERPLEWRERFNTLLLPPILGPAWVPPEAQAVTPTPAGTPTPAPAPTPAPTPTIVAPTPTPPPTPAAAPAPTPPPTKAPRRRGAWWN